MSASRGARASEITPRAITRYAITRYAITRYAITRYAITRRGLLAGAAVLVLLASSGCHCTGPQAGAAGEPGSASGAVSSKIEAPWHEVSFAPSAVYPEEERALILVPEGAATLPVVVALHGRGETRSLDTGARGFRDYYGLDRIDGRLRAPPITKGDLLGFTSDERLAKINASLAKDPYKGVVLACPYAPDLRDRSFAGAEPYARFVTEVLLPKAREKAGARAAMESTGIDGVSMGGRLALWIGFRFPELFGAVGAMQPALRVEEAEEVARLAAQARAKNPKLRIRLLSSEEDPFLPAVTELSARLTANGVGHDLVVVPGPHNYEFNKGPGSAEMLLWHDRVLRGLPSP